MVQHIIEVKWHSEGHNELLCYTGILCTYIHCLCCLSPSQCADFDKARVVKLVSFSLLLIALGFYYMCLWDIHRNVTDVNTPVVLAVWHVFLFSQMLTLSLTY